MIIFESEVYIRAAKMLSYFSLAFVVGMLIAPYLIAYLRHVKFWKKKQRTSAMNGTALEVTKKFYDKDESQLKVPRGGGSLIWITTFLIAFVFFIVLKLFPDNSTNKSISEFLNFIDSRQTFVPMAVLGAGALLGLADDYLATKESGGNYFAGGLKFSHRSIGVAIISILIGLWFHLRIGDIMHKITLPWWDSISGKWFVLDLEKIQLPFGWLDNLFQTVFGSNLNLSNGGWLIIPITVIVLMLLWGSSVIDGFDGITAGTLIPIFLAVAGLAFSTQFYQTAVMMSVITGAMVAYLWYNIPPAQFYMGDTGSTPLLLVLGVVVLLIDKLFILPIIGFLLFLTVGVNIIQISSKKFFKRKVFLAAPFHHHLEASGWLQHQVTMRYWLISIICSVLGFAFGLIITN
jgi:phospho-N-acetylmuramoyl-pentapeptide-transferase